MSTQYGKNLIDISHESACVRITRAEGKVSAATMPGTVGTLNPEKVFVPGNNGDLYVLDRNFLYGRTAQDEVAVGDFAAFIPCYDGRYFNVLLDKGLDVKPSYALYVGDNGLVTNVAPKEGAPVFAYAQESVVTTDAPKLVAAHIA